LLFRPLSAAGPAIFRLIAAALLGLGLAAAGSHGVARADPSPSDIEKQLDADWEQLEKVIEQYNKNKVVLDDNKRKVTALNQQLDPLRRKVDEMYAKVGAISSAYYKGGNNSAFNAMVTSGSPTTLIDQLSTLNLIAKHQQDAIHDVLAAKQKLDDQKKPIDDLVRQQTDLDTSLKQQDTQIRGHIDDMTKARQAAYANGGGGRLNPAGMCPVTYIGTSTPNGKAVNIACKQIGKSYIWATAGPDHYDCSGLLMYSWKTGAGISTPHNAAMQQNSMPSIAEKDLIPGDFVFYFSDTHHVGMYIGKGPDGTQWVLHAPAAGDVVRVQSMRTIAPVNGFGRPRY